jgi:hypothetical protein
VRLTCGALGIAGVLVLVGPALPWWEHYGSLLLRLVLAFLCFYMAIVIFERRRMQQDVKEVLGAFYAFNAKGRDDQTKRRAVGYMLDALSSSNPSAAHSALTQLQRLTGQDLGADPEAWRQWWRSVGDGFRFPADPTA